MPGGRPKRVDPKVVLTMWHAGRDVTAICRTWGWSRTPVYRVLYAAGVDPNSRRSEKWPKIIARLRDGATAKAVAREVGVSLRTVYEAARREGLSIGVVKLLVACREAGVDPERATVRELIERMQT